jgi:hypothetical protein
MFTRTLVVLGVVGAFATPPAQAQFTPKLDSSYSFVRISGAWADNCSAPNFDEVLGAEFGTVTFHPDGTLQTVTTDSTLCSDGTFTTGPSTEAGTYTLDSAGLLLMDLDPLNPGVQVIPLHMSWNHEYAVASLAMSGAPQLVFAIRQAEHMQTSDAFGAFDLITFGCGFDPMGHLGAWPGGGGIVFDGFGHFTNNYVSMNLDWPGTSQSGGADAGSYSVLPNGQVAIEGMAPSGALSQDGEVGFVLFADASGLEFNAFIKTPPTRPMPTLVGDWWSARLGGTKATQYTCEVGMFENDGLFTFGPEPGKAIGETGTSVFLDTAGGGAAPFANTGSYGIGVAGWINAGTLSGESYQIKMGNNQDLMFLEDFNNSYLMAQVGIMVRTRGALAGDVSTVSETAGGVQSLSLAAPPLMGGKLYFLVGSASGIWPGIMYGTQVLPLNLDSYFIQTVLHPNMLPLAGSLGVLDADGLATASVTLPPAIDPALVGIILNHAFLVLDPAAVGGAVLASNPVALEILP